MGTTRLAIYLVGLLVVVGAVWILLTQTAVAEVVPPGVALALILLLVGIGIMASARSIRDARTSTRVVHTGGTAMPPRDGLVERERETYVEEGRYD